MTCAVLAPAGPNRSRVLAALCRDERTAELPTFNILQKMFYEDVVSCDLRLDIPRHDDRFDAVRMEDVGNTTPNNASRDVICTVDVGLVSTDEINSAVRLTTVLKSKVVSDGMIPELWQVGKSRQHRQQNCESMPDFS